MVFDTMPGGNISRLTAHGQSDRFAVGPARESALNTQMVVLWTPRLCVLVWQTCLRLPKGLTRHPPTCQLREPAVPKGQGSPTKGTNPISWTSSDRTSLDTIEAKNPLFTPQALPSSAPSSCPRE